MLLREVSALAWMQAIAKVPDLAPLNRLRHVADRFGASAGQVLSGRAGTEDIGKRPLRLLDGTVLTAPGGEGCDPRGCRFTDFELNDGKGAGRLDRSAARADEIRLADRGFGSRPDSIREPIPPAPSWESLEGVEVSDRNRSMAVSMAVAIARTDLSARERRASVSKAKDAKAARRMPAIARVGRDDSVNAK
jgi:hypothetical protein